MVSIRALSSATALVALALGSASATSHMPAVRGRDEAASFAVNGTSREAVEQTITSTGAKFISLHFSQFSLANGDVVTINDASGNLVAEYTGLGRGGLGDKGGFYSTHAFSDSVTVKFKPSAEAPASGDYGFAIDKIVRSSSNIKPLTICSADQMAPPKCYLEDTRASGAYAKAQAVVRLVVNGGKFCTGWMVGSEGHMVTNNHCISTQEEASNTQYEFEAESSSCENTCGNAAFGCPGVIAATTATFLHTNKALDYTLVKLNANSDLSKYGYMKLRVAGGVDQEQIYVPQHPNGRAKAISLVSDNGEVIKATMGASDSCGAYRVGYDADTESGSSGSPVIAVSDNLVIGLHSCGTADTSTSCVNTGVDIRSIIYDLKLNNIVPADALDDPTRELPVGPWTPVATSAPTPAPTTDGCSNIKGQFLCAGLSKCMWVDAKCVPKATTSPAPTTATPTVVPTDAPTPEPTTAAPTPEPTTVAPTPAPTTPAPTTPAPTTPKPTTSKPVTPKPTTPKPTTCKPTPKPTTPKPTPKPTTPKPVTSPNDSACKVFPKWFCFGVCKWNTGTGVCVGM